MGVKRRSAAGKRPSTPDKKKKGSYHHWALRRALLDAAIAYLKRSDVTSLTIQVLARAAGVSPGAPYHHFPDKQSLLAALATEGFETLGAKLHAAHNPGRAAIDNLAAFARAYLEFAEEFPSHYLVMFLKDVEDRERFAAVHEASARSLQLLLTTLAEISDEAPERCMAKAVSVWSLCHGFAALRGAGVLGNIPGLPSLTALEAAAIQDVVAVVSPHT